MAGYSDGQNVYYELAGSFENGAFLDGGSRALISNTLGTSGVAGRYDFQVRGGQVSIAAPVRKRPRCSSCRTRSHC